MLVIVLITSLITFLVLIISSVIYIITLIVDESDDVNTDALGIDAHDFSLTPAETPLDHSLGHHSQSHNDYLHHHTCHELDASYSSNQVDDLQVDQASIAPGPQRIESVGQLTSDVADEFQATKTAEQSDISLLNTPILSDIAAKQPDSTLSQQQQQTEAKTLYNGLSHESVTSIQETLRSWQSSPTAQKTLIVNQLGAVASKQVFDDFDQKEIPLGGTALHWCKTRKSLDKLIKLGLPTEVLNKRCETALHVAVRRHKLQVMIGLLVQGANIEARNENGETPLILACKVNDIFACQLLLVFDADYKALDSSGNSARHYSANICDRHKVDKQLPPSAAHLILAMLNEIGAKRCPAAPVSIKQSQPAEQKQQQRGINKPAKVASSRRCTDGCSSTGQYNGNSYNRWPDYQSESLYKRHMFSNMIKERLAQAKAQKAPDSPGQSSRWSWRFPSIKQREPQKQAQAGNQQVNRSRLLCIDGGGLRGVIVCQIMIELEKYLKQPVVTYFDWIGGTSVGAFLACSLCSGINLKDLRRICFDVKDEVFSGSRPYNSKFIERVLKRTFGPNKRMSDVKHKKLAVTTVIADREPCQLRLFRNYKSPSQLLEMHGLDANKFDSMSTYSTIPPVVAAKTTSISVNNQRQTVPKRNSLLLPAGKSSSTPKGGGTRPIEKSNSSSSSRRTSSNSSKEKEPDNPQGKAAVATSGQANQGSQRSSLSPADIQNSTSSADKDVAPGAADLSSAAVDGRINQTDNKDIAHQQPSQLTATNHVPGSKSNVKAQSQITVDRDNKDKSSAAKSNGQQTSGTRCKSGNDPGASDADIDKATNTREDSIGSADYVIDENDSDPLMWQAVRASAAAPFFFKPYGPYLDGGIISNNPTLDMLSEFSNYQRVREFIRKRKPPNSQGKTTPPAADNQTNRTSDKKKSSIEGNRAEMADGIAEPTSKLDLVVSLGTGRGRVIGRQALVDLSQVASGFATVFSPRELVRSIRAARDLFRKLMQQSCHTEDHILDRAQAWCSSLDVPYFRVNPALTTIFSIDDKRDEQLINALWQTKLYMKAMSPQLKELADILDAQQ